MPTVVITASGTFTLPFGVGAVYATGPGGSGSGHSGTQSGGGGGGAECAGEPVLTGTVLTITIGSGAVTVTGGFVAGAATTITAHPGGNASAATPGAGGTGSTNTVANPGGAGGAGGTGNQGGGGGSSATRAAAGVAGQSSGAGGTAPAGGGDGGAGGAGSASPGADGASPGGGGGGSGKTSTTVATGGGAQVVISWSEPQLTWPGAPRRKLARAVVRFTPVGTVNAAPAAPPVSGTVQPWPAVPAPRRKLARAVVRFTPVGTVNAAPSPPVNGTVQARATMPVPRRHDARAIWHGIKGAAYVQVPAPRQQPGRAARRRPARAIWRGITGTVAVAALAGYPDAPLDATLELLLDGTWTDITQWALPGDSQYGQITSGTPDGAQQIQPASMSGTWDNGDARFSLRNTSGPYYGNLRQNIPARVSVASVWGTYLRLEGDGPDYAYTADNTALHITGSIEVRIAVMLSDWGASVLAARYGSSGTPSWLWGLQDDGTMLFTWFNSSGTQHTAASTVSVAYQPGAMALRVTLNASTGAVAFYSSAGQSIDGTWTQLGATVTGTATSVAAGNQPLTVGYSAYGGALGQVHGDVYGGRLYNGIGGAIVADAGFSSQPDGTTTWTDGTGLTWETSGSITAEISGRDYRLHGELASIAPTVATSGSVARVAAMVAGQLRRLQQGNAPPSVSPMRQALLARPGIYAPVALWPCEDPVGSAYLSSAIAGMPPLLFDPDTGSPILASQQPFGPATLPLPQLGPDAIQWQADIPAYTSNGSIVVRFLWDGSNSLPSSWSSVLGILTTGTAATVTVTTYSDGTFFINGYSSSGTTLFGLGGTISSGGYNVGSGPMWMSLEGTPSGTETYWTLNTLEPSGSTGGIGGGWYVAGAPGLVTQLNAYGAETMPDAVCGMISLQSAQEPQTVLADVLNAYSGENAVTRFRRICAGESIAYRIIGSAAGSATMGPQPTGSVLSVLQDCATADGGILFEPRTALGLGLRTRASMLAQPTAVTLSFDAADLPGSFQLIDDDQLVINNVTASSGSTTAATEASGATYTTSYTLDDGSAKSISPPPAGVGEYSTTITLNLDTEDALADAAEWYVAARTADAGRATGLTADFGVPGAPVTGIARLRAGDRIVVEDPPDTYQTDDITQIVQYSQETFGPGRQIAWDCWPSAPWDDA